MSLGPVGGERLPRDGEYGRLGGDRGLSFSMRGGELYLSRLYGGGDLSLRLPTGEASRSRFKGSGDRPLAPLGDLGRSSLRELVS